jgi:hypothetical protein
MNDKRTALKTIFGKLEKLFRLLASDNPGEVFNAAQAMKRLLASAKLDFHDLITIMSGEEAPILDLLRSLLEKDQDALVLGWLELLCSTRRTGRPSLMSRSARIA